jgi:transcriptional regulator with XRE-family HTH domain
MGLTQRQVAARIGMKQGQYSRLERSGYRSMQLEQLAALTRALETSADYLLLVREDDTGTIPLLACPGEAPRLDGTTLLLTTISPEGGTVDGEYTTRPVPADLP